MSNTRNGFRLSLIALSASLLLSAPAQGQSLSPGATTFEKRCYSCHNVGGGDKKGPGLKGVTIRRPKGWLREFVKSPARSPRAIR